MTTLLVNGLKGLSDYFEKLPDIAAQAASYAINDVAGGTGLTLLRKSVYEQIDFPNGYLNQALPTGGTRLGLVSKANKNKLEAVIKGRDRPTSLARFANKGQTPKSTAKRGVSITVKGKNTKFKKNAWLVNLRNGNLGLAVRLAPGERLNKHTASKVQIAPDIFLLYGPSVDQVLRGVADEKSDEMASMVARQFFRQFERLSNA